MEYHKIQSVFKRDPATHKVIEGEFSLPEFEYLRDNMWDFSEKIDGTNCRVYWTGQDVEFRGRTDRAQFPTFLYTKLEQIFKPKTDLFREIFMGNDKEEDGSPSVITLYGEGYGKGIQKGGKYIPDGVDFILFDIRIGHWWLRRNDVGDIAGRLGINMVPLYGEGTLDELVAMVKEGITSHFGDFQAEGIVARPNIELKARSGQRIITKLKTKDF